MDQGGAIRIRDARLDELDEVAGVMLAAYQEYSAPLGRMRWEAYAQDIVDVRGRLEDSELIVADVGKRIAGAVTFYPDGSRRSWPVGWSGIRLLAVHPQDRGLGIGKALTEECIGRSRERGMTSVGLRNPEIMSVARGMYMRMGFVPAPELDDPTPRDGAAIAYRLDL